ncbi:hypothetical protein [Nesterenkonia suensis]
MSSADGTPETPLPTAVPHDEDHIIHPRDRRAERLAEHQGTAHQQPNGDTTR